MKASNDQYAAGFGVEMQTAISKTGGLGPFMETLLLKPVKELTFVAFDTETTGRHPIISGLLEISGVKFRGNGELLEIRSQLMNPGRAIPEEVTAIHGITNDMVADKPPVSEVIPSFLSWMRASPSGSEDDFCPNIFVAHNASFDVNFIQVALTGLGLELPDNLVLDTLQLVRSFVKDAKNYRLKTLVENLGESSGAVYHRAEADSLHVMRVFLDIIKRAGEDCTLAQLVEKSGLIFFSKPYELVSDHQSASDKRVQIIGEAIRSGADLQIHYKGHGIKHRQITPLSLLYFGKRFFLRAFCHAAGSERTFRVDRIATLDLVERQQTEF